MKLTEIQKATKAELTPQAKDKTIVELLIDSRKIINPAKAMFIAIKGTHRDGHEFIPDAYQKGVRSFLISGGIDQRLYPDAVFLLVPDTLTALQQLAATYRNQFHFPIIGITGSNGKTIVKEWLFQLLSDNYKIIRSPKSYNSQIGVPLSVWRMQEHYNLGIFEAGISQPGEMSHSEKILHPEIGIFTNIGEAHSEGFLNMRQKINEKLVLFRHSKDLIYCKDHHELHECIVQYCHQVRSSPEDPLKLFTWSQKSEATLRIQHIEKKQHGYTDQRCVPGAGNVYPYPLQRQCIYRKCDPLLVPAAAARHRRDYYQRTHGKAAPGSYAPGVAARDGQLYHY